MKFFNMDTDKYGGTFSSLASMCTELKIDMSAINSIQSTQTMDESYSSLDGTEVRTGSSNENQSSMIHSTHISPRLMKIYLQGKEKRRNDLRNYQQKKNFTKYVFPNDKSKLLPNERKKITEQIMNHDNGIKSGKARAGETNLMYDTKCRNKNSIHIERQIAKHKARMDKAKVRYFDKKVES